jgi:HD superfamily phosphodiesterase
MIKHQKVADLVEKTYQNSSQDFAKWMWENHVPIVASNTEELSHRFNANADIAVAGAWLHDFGDAFVDRHSNEHDEVSKVEATKVLNASGYSDDEIKKVLGEVILPHSCKDGFLPTTIEGQVMATADALAHLTTDFYVQFAWKHLPEGKSYEQYLEWVAKKLERDCHDKIFFDEVREEVRHRYVVLKEVFVL